MGMFDVTCCASGVALQGSCCLLLMARKGNEGDYQLVSLPIRSCYNRYGYIDAGSADLDEHGRTVHAFLQTIKYDFPPRDKGAEAHLQAMWEIDAHLGEMSISYVLFDEGVYSAIAKMVATGSRPAWAHLTDARVKALSTEELFVAAFPLADVSRRIYAGVAGAAREALRPALVELIRFRAWGTKLVRAWEVPSDQLCGYEGEYGAHKFSEPARKKFAAFPLILQAIEENAACWKQIDQDG